MISQTPIESIYNNSAGVWDSLKNPSIIDELINRKRIISLCADKTGSKVQLLHKYLTDALINNPRLLLYLPSELIPHWSEKFCSDATRGYILTIHRTFRDLVYNYEPRSSYTDGDDNDNTPLISPMSIVARILVDKMLLKQNWYEHFHDSISRSYNDDLETILPDVSSGIDYKRAAWIKKEKIRRQQPIDYNKVNLSGKSLCDNLSNNLLNSEDEIRKIYNIITTDKGLEFLYPVVIFYGSRLKGYGSQSSDLDFAVFVKEQLLPTVDRPVEKYINDRIPGAMTFWLNNNLKNLSIHAFKDDAPHLGAPFDAHILFNGVWVGDDNIKLMLCDRLLKPMVDSPQLIKDFYIKELERDLLKYRLLHRGYETYYQSQKPVFLDDGYRWLATKLYLKYVFIP